MAKVPNPDAVQASGCFFSAILLLAFAAEVALKRLYSQETGKRADWVHDLSKLFQGLRKTTRDSLRGCVRITVKSPRSSLVQAGGRGQGAESGRRPSFRLLFLRDTVTLRSQVREREGRDATPSAAIIESQSVKTTEKGGLGATTQARGGAKDRVVFSRNW